MGCYQKFIFQKNPAIQLDSKHSSCFQLLMLINTWGFFVGLLAMLSTMTILRVFFLFHKYMMFLNILFYCIFQETKVEKLQKHPCSQAPNPVLGFSEQTELSICQAEGRVPCTGRIKGEQ